MSEMQPNKVKYAIRPRKGALIICALLLFLPRLNIIDFFPDALAYLILLFVIAPYAVIDSHIAEAQKYLEQLLLIGAAEIVSVPFVYVFLSKSPQEQPMMVLLCCFVFAFFRIKIVLSLTRALGDGLSYLDMRNDGTMFCQSFMRRLISLRRGKKRVRKYSYSVTDRMMRAIRTFVIATSVLNTLPELSALSYLPGDDTVFQLYDYIALLRGFSMMVSLIFGVVFVCRVLRFTRDIGTDLAYYARLQALYVQDEAMHPERQTQKYLRRTFALITLFSVFTMDFTVDRVNVLPDFMAALFLVAAFWMLRSYASHITRYLLIAAGYAAASVAHFALNTAFWSRYNPESIARSERVRAAYIPVQVLSVIEGIMLLLVLLCLMRVLYEIIERYTGYEIEGTVNYSREEKLREEHMALQRALIPVEALGVMSACCGPMYTFLRPTVEFAWIFSVLIPAIFAITLSGRLLRIRDGVDSRFMLK